MSILQNIFLSTFYFFLICVGCWFLADIFRNIGFRSESNYIADETSTEVPEDTVSAPRYDVNAFKERIYKMQNEDRLYDIVDPPEASDFTGTEIIRPDVEPR